jgi:hypothetical protein
MDKIRNKALLFAGSIAGLNNRVALATKPATEEFFHISPALITSSATKRGGVNKYLNLISVGNCKIQTSDLQVERLIQKAQIRKIVIGTSVTMKSGTE